MYVISNTDRSQVPIYLVSPTCKNYSANRILTVIQNTFTLDKLDIIKTKILGFVKDSMKMTKRQITNGEKIFCKSHIQKRACSLNIENFQIQYFQKRTIQLENWQKICTDISPKRIDRWRIST